MNAIIDMETVEKRFWSKVQRAGPDECWPWLAGRFRPSGKGNFWFAGHNQPAPRMAWFLTHGYWASDLLVCHTCDNPPCCNPAHLFLGTPLDNMRDKVAKGRHVTPSGENHWTKIHPHLVKQGADSCNAKLTEPLVRYCRSLWRSGLSYAEISARLKTENQITVSPYTVKDAVKRVTWKHLR